MSVASTYAEALHGSAVDRDQVTEVATGLRELRDAIAGTPELATLLDDPQIETRVKKDVIGSLLADTNPLVANFVQVLLDRGRAGEIEEIGAAFDERVAAAEGRLRVTVRTAIPLPDDLKAAVIARIQAQTGRPVDVETVVDESIVGGVVIETDGSVVDASVRQRLTDLHRSMAAAPVQAAVTGD